MSVCDTDVTLSASVGESGWQVDLDPATQAALAQALIFVPEPTSDTEPDIAPNADDFDGPLYTVDYTPGLPLIEEATLETGGGGTYAFYLRIDLQFAPCGRYTLYMFVAFTPSDERLWVSANRLDWTELAI